MPRARIARLLLEGVHVGVLVDQYFNRGVEVTFFGRRCLTNPLAAVLARQTECPIHGLRMVRLPDRNRFSVESPKRSTRARRQRPRRRPRHHAGITSIVEGSDSRTSRAMALAASALAAAGRRRPSPNRNDCLDSS